MIKKIVLIDDEPDILEFLSYNLKKEGFQTEIFTDPLEALSHIERYSADMVITDWLMPQLEGLEICRKLKRNAQTAAIPIFMISCKNDEIDVVTALELGVEDYLSKPFRMKELITRVKKIFNRDKAPQAATKHIIIRNDLKIDSENYTVYIKDNRLTLTNCEFKLLQLLASMPGKVFSRDNIIELINKDDHIVVTLRSIDVQIVGLRKKLGEYRNYVETVRSVGYRFSTTER